MRLYTVIVEDENHNVVFNKLVDLDMPRGTDFEQVSDAEYAIAAFSPEICPFDCDYCRS